MKKMSSGSTEKSPAVSVTRLRRADIVLAAVLLAAGIAACVICWNGGTAGERAVVTVDGEVYGTYSLSENQEIDIDREGAHNHLRIKDGRALMTEASCPDKYCMGQHKSAGGIYRSNENIVCLPNRVVVTIEADEEPEFDAVTK